MKTRNFPDKPYQKRQIRQLLKKDALKNVTKKTTLAAKLNND